jgi:hypothetical protein
MAFVVATVTAQVNITPLVDVWQNDETSNEFTLVTLSTLIRDGDNAIVVNTPPRESTTEQNMMDGNCVVVRLRLSISNRSRAHRSTGERGGIPAFGRYQCNRSLSFPRKKFDHQFSLRKIRYYKSHLH